MIAGMGMHARQVYGVGFNSHCVGHMEYFPSKSLLTSRLQVTLKLQPMCCEYMVLIGEQ